MNYMHTITYDEAKKWYDSGRKGLRNEQGAVEYVPNAGER